MMKFDELVHFGTLDFEDVILLQSTSGQVQDGERFPNFRSLNATSRSGARLV